MKGYFLNIEEETLKNIDYRRVLFTANNSQLVLMSIEPGDEIGNEVHTLDQFIRIEQGKAEVNIDGEKTNAGADWAFIIPAGAEHNVSNIGVEPLKLYSIYSPPEHKHGTVHKTKADEKEEHFDGETSIEN